MKILHAVGARPNFVKLAPVMEALRGDFDQVLVHTGQHDSAEMSAVFFDELEIQKPDHHIGIGNCTRCSAVGKIVSFMEGVLEQHCPDWVFIYGDVTSTAACAIAAAQMQMKVAHVEAGLRCFDRSMPEEMNRVIADHLSTVLFASCADAERNLRREGIEDERIVLVGNVMIDTLNRTLPHTIPKNSERTVITVTLHRPVNVDDPMRLKAVMQALNAIAEKHDAEVIFPVHPRTNRKLGVESVRKAYPRITFCPPMGYLDFVKLLRGSRIVVTDSGGVQEETSFLGVSCLTFRESTERPVTCEMGTNKVIGTDPMNLGQAVNDALSTDAARPIIPMWDGHAAKRIAAHMKFLA